MTTYSEFLLAQDREAVQILACLKLREQGWVYRDIGAALGRSHEWVRQTLKRYTLSPVDDRPSSAYNAW